jgi:hypothetical protein
MDEFLRTIYYHSLVSTHIPVPYDNSIKFTPTPDDAHPLYVIHHERDVFKAHAKLNGTGYGKGSRDDCGTSQGAGMSMDVCGHLDGTSDLKLPF